MKTIELISKAILSGATKNKCCEELGISIRTLQRWNKEKHEDGRLNNRIKSSNALSEKEIKEIVKICCSEEYRDMSPNQIVPVIAEKGNYIASERTMYRVLKKKGLLKHRSESKAPKRNKPDEFVATGPNQVWSWDITYLLRTKKGEFFYLYLIVDIWDRYIVGWAIHEKELGYYSRELLKKTLMIHGVKKNQLTLHQDNGGPMIAVEFLSLLKTWHVSPSYSRPGVCDDNPYSESLFKTLKYRPAFPKRFENIELAEKYVAKFVDWYNNEHRHSKISFVTPYQRRSGKDIEILKIRKKVYLLARENNPKRWSGNIRNWSHIEEVILNPKKSKKLERKKSA